MRKRQKVELQTAKAVTSRRLFEESISQKNTLPSRTMTAKDTVVFASSGSGVGSPHGNASISLLNHDVRFQHLTPTMEVLDEEIVAPSSSEDGSEPQAKSMKSLLLLTQIAAAEDLHITKDQPYSCSHQKSLQLRQQLDELQRTSHPYTARQITALADAIQELQSRAILLQVENDAQSQDIQQLYSKLKETHKENNKLEKSLARMTRKYQKLLDKSERQRRERKTLIQHVKSLLQKGKTDEVSRRDLEEANQVYKIYTHEQFLAQSVRERTTSTDSNFSDADALDFGEDGQGDDSASSKSSNISLVTSECVATVRLAAAAKPQLLSPLSNTEGHETWTTSSETSGSGTITTIATPNNADDSSRLCEYSLRFINGAKTGLMIHEIALNQQSIDEISSPSALLSSAMLEENEVGDCVPLQGTTPHKNAFSMSFGFESFLHRNKAEDKDIQDIESRAFLVSGYTEDFDSEANTKPPVGARLIAIDNKPVHDTWTLTDVYEKLRATCGDDVNDRHSDTLTLSFRNDTLSTKCKEALKQQIEAESNEVASEMLICTSKEKFYEKASPFSFGFLKPSSSTRKHLKEIEPAREDAENSSAEQDTSKAKKQSVIETEPKESLDEFELGKSSGINFGFLMAKAASPKVFTTQDDQVASCPASASSESNCPQSIKDSARKYQFWKLAKETGPPCDKTLSTLESTTEQCATEKKSHSTTNSFQLNFWGRSQSTPHKHNASEQLCPSPNAQIKTSVNSLSARASSRADDQTGDPCSDQD